MTRRRRNAFSMIAASNKYVTVSIPMRMMTDAHSC